MGKEFEGKSPESTESYTWFKAKNLDIVHIDKVGRPHLLESKDVYSGGTSARIVSQNEIAASDLIAMLREDLRRAAERLDSLEQFVTKPLSGDRSSSVGAIPRVRYKADTESNLKAFRQWVDSREGQTFDLGEPEAEEPDGVVMNLHPGNATAEEVADVLVALNKLHIAAGGDGFDFSASGASIVSGDER